MNSSASTPLRDTNLRRLDAALHVLALIACLFLAGRSLDRRELDPAEAEQATLILAGLEGGPLPGGEISVAHRVLAHGALIFGTTERALRIAGVAAILCAILLTASIAGALFGPRARAIAVAVAAASSSISASARLEPALLGLLPAALLGLLWLPARTRSQNALILLGAVLIPLLAPCLEVPLAAVFVLVGCGLAGRPPERALAISGGCMLLLPHLLGAPWRMLPLSADPARGAGIEALLPGFKNPIDTAAALVFLAGFLLYLLTPSVLRQRALPIALALLVATALAAVPGGFDVAEARLSLLLPFLMLLAADGASRMSATAGRMLAGACLALLLLLAMRPVPEEAGMADARARLLAVRSVGASGGRLILAGPERFRWQYYARRGHAPGMPVLLVPEDVSANALAPRLEHALGMSPGSAAAPPVLLLAPPEQRFPALLRSSVAQGLASQLTAVAAPR